MPGEYYADYRWFLERQANLLDDLAVNDYAVIAGLAARNELYGFGVAVACLGMHAEQVVTTFEAWRELIAGIRALQLDSYGIAERLRALRTK